VIAYRRAMRPFRALVIYIIVVFLGGALLAPWLYWLVQAVPGGIPKLAHEPFHRFVNRSMLLLALAGLWPLLRQLGARSVGGLGLVKPKGQWQKLFAGFLLGFISLAVLAVLALAGGGRLFQENLLFSKVIKTLSTAALTAVTVAVLEEILFRGGIFGGLRRVFHWRWALAVSSAIYAIVHFLARTGDPQTVVWNSGFGQLALMLAGFTDWHALIPGFFNLTLAGALLALAYQRTGNLYFSIGLHAGWIFWLRSYGMLTVDAPKANHWLWGSDHMIDGWLALVVLAFTLAVFLRLRLVEKSNRPT
jgi:CAAX protease family protein